MLKAVLKRVVIFLHTLRSRLFEREFRPYARFCPESDSVEIVLKDCSVSEEEWEFFTLGYEHRVFGEKELVKLVINKASDIWERLELPRDTVVGELLLAIFENSPWPNWLLKEFIHPFYESAGVCAIEGLEKLPLVEPRAA